MYSVKIKPYIFQGYSLFVHISFIDIVYLSDERREMRLI